MIRVDGTRLTIADLERFARGAEEATLDPKVRPRLGASRAVIGRPVSTISIVRALPMARVRR